MIDERKRVRDEKRKIRVAFKWYYVWRNECAEKIADAAYKVSAPPDTLRSGKSTSRSLRAFDYQILKVLSSDIYMWCKVVQDTIEYYQVRHADEFVNLIDYKYFKGMLDWEIMDKLSMSRTTVYSTEDRIISKAREFAIKYHLLEP